MKLLITRYISLVLFVCLTSCGMQGDLYLPEDKTETSIENSPTDKTTLL